MTAASEGSSSAPLPFGLDREAHVNRDASPWPRRAVVTLMTVFAALALANTFGQVSSVAEAGTSQASLTVDSPARLRSGLMFTSVITIVAHQQIQDARLLLTPGWFNGMTLNAFAPQSSQSTSNALGTVLDFGQVDAGATMPVWISWQTNPTTLGGRDADVRLYDGQKLLLTVHRSVFVFP
jgi:hypothetical protein